MTTIGGAIVGDSRKQKPILPLAEPASREIRFPKGMS